MIVDSNIINLFFKFVFFLMDIEKQQSQWAKSTESRIEVFLDSYVIRSPIQSVRASSQRLILSLFKKGNE
jgi:hypothetical protein